MKTGSRRKGKWMKLHSNLILGEMLRKKGFSQERLARYAGCSGSFISQLLKGTKTSCSRELAEEIAEALDVPWQALFAESESTDGRSIRKREAGKRAAA